MLWDAHRDPMITHTSDSHQVPILQGTLHATHLLKLLDEMYKYDMDPTRTVGATEQTQDAGRKDRQTDGVKPIYPRNNFVVRGV